MKYFFDTEFIDNGGSDLHLVSIGIVSEDGRSFYIENADVDLDTGDLFFQTEVRPHLKGGEFLAPYNTISIKLREYVGLDYPEFWAWVATWDWLLLTRTFGRLPEIPKRWPYYVMDAKQLSVELGSPPLPANLFDGLQQHNALDDAHWLRKVHFWLESEWQKRQVQRCCFSAKCCKDTAVQSSSDVFELVCNQHGVSLDISR